MSTPGVRAALANLAQALSEDPKRVDEAVDAIGRALAEPGDSPADWELMGQLGNIVSRQTGRGPQAFHYYVRSIAEAPPEAQRELAGRALKLLDGTDGIECARAVPTRTMELLCENSADAFRRTTTAAADHDEVASLVARILLLRGSVDQAQQVALGSSAPTIENDPVLVELSVSARAGDLLRAGRVEEAAEWLAGQDPTGPDSPIWALRAWCSYARGDLEATIKQGRASSRNAELALAEALALLRQAADQGDDGSLANQAVIAAGRASRLEPSRAEVFVVRAQVLLERDIDLTEGRSLLDKGLGRLRDVTGAVYWWPLQQQARRDEHFAYFELECAAMMGDHAAVLGRSGDLFGTALTTHQDAAILELRARALAETGAAQEAAATFGDAARHHQAAGDAISQLACLREQLQVEPAGPAATDLAEALWAGTLETGDPISAAPHLDEACAVLEANTATIPEDTVGRANVVLGLTLMRRLDLDLARPGRYATTLPYLVIAAEGNTTESFFQGHLSLALQRAGFDHLAYHYAERAVQLLPTELWLCERLADTGFGWYGTFEEKLLAASAPGVWTQALLTNAAMWEARHDDLARLLDDPALAETDDLRAQVIHAYAVALVQGFDAARGPFTTLLREAAAQNDAIVAADLAVLVEPESARALAANGANDGQITPLRAAGFEALADIVISGGSAGVDDMRDYLSRVPRPAALMAYFNIDAPVLISAHPDSASLHEALASLADFARGQTRRTLETPLFDETVDQRGDPVHDLACHLLTVGLVEASDGPEAAAVALDRVDLGALRTGSELAQRGLEQWRERLVADQR